MQSRKLFSAAFFALACATSSVALVALPFAATPAIAAKSQSIGNKVGKPLKEAQDLANKKQFKEALAKVREAQAIEKKSAFEDHTINEFLGYVAANLKDYPTAAKAFDATTKSGFLTAEQLPERVKTVAQLYYQVNDYKNSLATADRYLKEFGNDRDLQVMVGQIHYLQKDYAKTAAAMDKLLKSTSGKPEESWLQLAMSAAYHQKDMTKVATYLKGLVRHYPSDENWQQLLDVSMSGQNLSDRLNLDYYRLRRANNLINSGDELVEMAQLAVQMGLPAEAQTILEKGFADGLLGGANKDRETRLLNMAKSQAAELLKDLPTVEKEAAAAKTGEATVSIGEAYASYGQAEKAVTLISNGIAKGGLKNPDDATLHLALAQLQAGNKSAAQSTLKGIGKDTALGKVAELWSLYIGNL